MQRAFSALRVCPFCPYAGIGFCGTLILRKFVLTDGGNNMDLKERALKAHEQWGGKIEVIARC